jgi:hypothetical protein
LPVVYHCRAASSSNTAPVRWQSKQQHLGLTQLTAEQLLLAAVCTAPSFAGPLSRLQPQQTCIYAVLKQPMLLQPRTPPAPQSQRSFKGPPPHLQPPTDMHTCCPEPPYSTPSTPPVPQRQPAQP